MIPIGIVTTRRGGEARLEATRIAAAKIRSTSNLPCGAACGAVVCLVGGMQVACVVRGCDRLDLGARVLRDEGANLFGMTFDWWREDPEKFAVACADFESRMH
jgi:hypothetical protein